MDDLEDTVLSEISQTEKEKKTRNITYTWNHKKKKKIGKLGLPGTKGLGVGEIGKVGFLFPNKTNFSRKPIHAILNLCFKHIKKLIF